MVCLKFLSSFVKKLFFFKPTKVKSLSHSLSLTPSLSPSLSLSLYFSLYRSFSVSLSVSVSPMRVLFLCVSVCLPFFLSFYLFALSLLYLNLSHCVFVFLCSHPPSCFTKKVSIKVSMNNVKIKLTISQGNIFSQLKHFANSNFIYLSITLMVCTH